MKKHFKSLMTLTLALMMTLAVAVPAAAAVSASDVNSAVADTAAYVQKTVTSPVVGSIGGEWTVLGLARSNAQVPAAYYENYYNNVVKYVQSKQGVLHNRKYTEYSRVALALTAIGKDPANVGGYNLLTPLGDYENTVYQGINGPIFALIALDSRDYAMPQNPQAKTQATRDMYLNYILDKQLTDGGWALSGAEADADITAMALQALANYQDRAAVKAAIDKGLTCLSALQNADGSFNSWGSSNCESVCQAIVALGSLHISLDDSRLVKNGNTLLDALLSFYTKGGGFRHVEDLAGGNNLMATEQGLYALAAAQRANSGKNSLYDMSDVSSNNVTPAGSFADVQGHKNQKAIEELAAKQIINGMPDGSFQPNATMTRAEFATIVVKALGLTPKETKDFSDVKRGAWYSGFIGAAYNRGIVKGVSADKFSPNSVITREEAATMVSRAAAIMLQNFGQSQSAETLAKGKELLVKAADNAKVSVWARDAVADCLGQGIMESGENLQPQKAILRCEIAQMIYNMLNIK